MNSRSQAASIRISDEVTAAVNDKRPVVALESAVITAGLPRTPLPATIPSPHAKWNGSSPINLELARCMAHAVRDAGAVPAITAVIDGTLHVGLTDEQLNRLATDADAGKSSARDLAHAIATRRTAGTTVSAALAACDTANRATPGLCVFATGGIGGVHRGWTTTPDISEDLIALARTPVCAVCSGAKSILDIPATLESLETLGVPVVGFRCDRFPQFHSQGSDALRVPARVDSVNQIAALCHAHWHTLGRHSAVLVANPVPAETAIPHDQLEQMIRHAEVTAQPDAAVGPARTPHLLAALAAAAGGNALRANLALLLDNARLAAEIAVPLARVTFR